MAKINVIKQSDCFIPANPHDRDLMLQFHNGDYIELESKKPRNGKFHRKFFAMLNVVVQHSDYDNVLQVKHLLKLKLGYFDKITNTDGRITYQTKSISFASMEETDFQVFYQQCVTVIIRDFLPTWDLDDFDNALGELMSFA